MKVILDCIIERNLAYDGIFREYEIKVGEDKIGTIVVLYKEDKQHLYIKKIFIEKEYRNRLNGENSIKILCSIYQDVIITGDILYEGPINFWSKFDTRLKKYKSYEARKSFLDMYGLFEFESKSILKLKQVG